MQRPLITLLSHVHGRSRGSFRRWASCTTTTSLGAVPGGPTRPAGQGLESNQACAWVLEEMEQLEVRGGASIRENPARSLHWALPLPQEQRMWQSGRWRDKTYVCAGWILSQVATAAPQPGRDRRLGPPMACHHSHDPKEWEPVERTTGRFYPSKEEAEYTAPLCFAVAVAASWWAARTGRAVLRVPRTPAVECVGCREDWLLLDPRAMREWAMAPVALSLKLRL